MGFEAGVESECDQLSETLIFQETEKPAPRSHISDKGGGGVELNKLLPDLAWHCVFPQDENRIQLLRIACSASLHF
jgi:hypothetical protein